MIINKCKSSIIYYNRRKPTNHSMPFNNGVNMKIVVVHPPKLIKRILAKIFKINKEK